jgi:hypothetical protein
MIRICRLRVGEESKTQLGAAGKLEWVSPPEGRCHQVTKLTVGVRRTLSWTLLPLRLQQRSLAPLSFLLFAHIGQAVRFRYNPVATRDSIKIHHSQSPLSQRLVHCRGPVPTPILIIIIITFFYSRLPILRNAM